MRQLTFRAAALLVLVCTALTPASANAADKKTGSEDQKGRMTFKHSRVVNAPGLRVNSVVADALQAFEADRKAGKFATAAEEKRARRQLLQRAFGTNRSGEGLQTKVTAAGSASIDLGGQYQFVMLSRVNANGSVSTACVADWQSAEAFLDGAGDTE